MFSFLSHAFPPCLFLLTDLSKPFISSNCPRLPSPVVEIKALACRFGVCEKWRISTFIWGFGKQIRQEREGEMSARLLSFLRIIPLNFTECIP